MVVFKALSSVKSLERARALLFLFVVSSPLIALTACQAFQTVNATANAQNALEAAVRDYEKGSLKTLGSMLPASFVGRDSLLDAARRAITDQRQTRIELTELKVQGLTDASSQAISLRWEKRFIRASTGLPVLERGSMQVVLRQTSQAASQIWLIDNLAADNLFTR